MFKVISWGSLLSRSLNRNAVKRTFLSKAYQCEEAWSNRLKNPIFSKINVSNMYHDLDFIFQKKLRVSVVDVDLFLNGIDDPTFKNEVEDVLLKIRLCPESSILPERATHAAIRYLMDNVPKEDILNALSDRINYGLFPNHHLTNILIDKYLKENDASSAVKIAVLQMLQEDLDHPIMKALALHSCYNYLESPDVWQPPSEDPDEGEEPVKVRVRFVRNPYFDDHFDIQVPNHLVGKTLWLFGHSLGGTFGLSSQLVGLVLYEKYEMCVELLESVISKKSKVHGEAVVKAKEYAVRRPKQGGEGEGGEGGEGSGVKEGSEGGDGHREKMLELLGKLDKSVLVEGSLLKLSEGLVREAVKENEEKDIQELCEKYKEWEVERERDIQEEVSRMEKVKAMEEIEKMKEEMRKEEQKLFYFDKEDEIELVASQNMEKNKSLRWYKLKGKEKAFSTEDYIPPNL